MDTLEFYPSSLALSSSRLKAVWTSWAWDVGSRVRWPRVEGTLFGTVVSSSPRATGYPRSVSFQIKRYKTIAQFPVQ